MPMNYRTAAVTNIAGFLTEIKNEAQTLGATINYFSDLLVEGTGGLHFTIPNGTGRGICLEYDWISNPGYRQYIGGLTTGYNDAAPHDHSAQPGAWTMGQMTRWTADYSGDEAMTLHILSKASPFSIYVFAQRVSNHNGHRKPVNAFFLCDLATLGGHADKHSLLTALQPSTTSGELFQWETTQMFSTNPVGIQATQFSTNLLVGDTYYEGDFIKPQFYTELFTKANPQTDMSIVGTPIPITVYKRDGNYTMLGHCPDAYLTNRKERGFGELFSKDGKNYRLFPAVAVPDNSTQGIAIEVS